MIESKQTVSMENKAVSDFMTYAQAVIVNRALPDVRDNLKPVHRRILYGMKLLKLTSNSGFMKSARVTGEVMGKLHPHGDASIYDAMVRLSQSWKMRYPLIEIHGNNGSLNGDSAAAARYTEARLSPAGEALLGNLSKDNTNFIPNYDDTDEEPVCLPSVFPNILCNGNEGIAVGMSCSLLPHNLSEVVQSIKFYIDNPFMTYDDLMNILPGPDFPLGGIIVDGQKLKNIYATGQGTITMRAVNTIDTSENSITFSQFPYLVDVDTKIIASIKKMKLDGYDEIQSFENHIGKDSCFIKVILSKNANIKKVLGVLYDKTPLQKTVKINNTVIRNGVPVQLGVINLIKSYVDHQHDVISKTAQTDLDKYKHQLMINEGLLLAVKDIDNVITTIRNSNDKLDANNKLITLLHVNAEQANAILGIQLSRLTKLDQDDLLNKINNCKLGIAEQQSIIEDKYKRSQIIKSTLDLMDKKFGDKRLTTILYQDENELKEGTTEDDSTTGLVLNLSNGTTEVVDLIEVEGLFKKGGKCAKLEVKDGTYVDKKHILYVNTDGTTCDHYDGYNHIMIDNNKPYILTISNNGIIKKSLRTEYKTLARLCKVKKEDNIFTAYCCSDDECLTILMDNNKVYTVKVGDIKISGKLTIGVKVISHGVKDAMLWLQEDNYFTLDSENHLKKGACADLSVGTLKINDNVIQLGVCHDNMFAYADGRLIPIKWDDLIIKGVTAQGAKASKIQISKIV